METLEDAIEETKAVLQPIFSKPKCSTKLLTKPPFRFLHDIVTATLKATGFPEGLFHPEELHSKNIKEKAAKIAFLEKLIYLVSVCIGSAINTRSTKIVAGQEPYNTNVLLAAFGRIAVDENFDHAGAIAHCIRGGPIEGFIKPTKQKKQNENQLSEKKSPAKRKNRKKSSLKESEMLSGEKIIGGEDKKNSESVEEMHINGPTQRSNREKPNDSTGETYPNQRSNSVSIKEQIEQCNSDPERTRQVIGSIVSKPKCSDKLLGKPPFRFLHDLIMAVGKASHYDLESVFSQEEMDSSNVKEKQSKLNFLEKIIKDVELKLGIQIEAKPGKIVAGLEAEKTCHFLQLFALVVTIDKTRSEGKEEEELDQNLMKQALAEEKSNSFEGSHLDAVEDAKNREGNDVVFPEDTLQSNRAAEEINFDESNQSDKRDVLAGETQQNKSSASIPMKEQIEQCNSDPERTRQVIGSIVSKPKCSDKLLGKPPFRFLHDLIMAVGKASHYDLESVFSQEEMDSSNVKEKQSKLNFLEKIIKDVELKLGIQIEAKPGKIVAGLEAEKTCHFLQLFALVVTIDKTKSNDEIAQESSTLKHELDMNNMADPEDKESDEKQHGMKMAEEKSDDDAVLQRPVSNLLPTQTHNQEEPPTANRTTTVSFKETPKTMQMEESINRNTFVGHDAKERETHSDGYAEKPLRSIRPSTARRRPPRVKDQSFKVEEDVGISAVQEKPKIFTDDDDGEADFFGDNLGDAFVNSPKEEQKIDSHDLSTDGHTAIVQKIFNDQTEKRIQDSAKNNDQEHKKQGNASKNRFRLHTKTSTSAQKVASDLSSTDLEKLASSIQSLTQSTAPLGRCMDFVQEDLSQMIKEREYWKSGHQRHIETFIKPKIGTKDDRIEQLQKSLDSLENKIEEKLRQIEGVKRQIARNDNWIKKHVDTVLSN